VSINLADNKIADFKDGFWLNQMKAKASHLLRNMKGKEGNLGNFGFSL